jgi:hypothetical protein
MVRNDREHHQLRDYQEADKVVEFFNGRRGKHLRQVTLRQRQDSEGAHLQQQLAVPTISM